MTDLYYDEQTLRWPGYGDFKATSGLVGWQNPSEECEKDRGPVPEGLPPGAQGGSRLRTGRWHRHVRAQARLCDAVRSARTSGGSLRSVLGQLGPSACTTPSCRRVDAGPMRQ